MERFIDNWPPMDLMRSEKMTFVQLIIPVESAHRAVSYLGELGLLQFRDLNADKSPFQRTFVNQVKRCAEMSRKLRFFKDQISKAGLLSSMRPVMQPDVELEELEIQLAEHENELIEMNSNSEKLRQSYNELLEFKIVLQKAGGFLVSSGSHAVSERELNENVYSNNDYVETASLLEQEMRPGRSDQSGLRFISGIICKSKALRFERMLFRATRGNMLFNQAPADEEIMDPVSYEMVEKTAFVVFFSGEQAKTKILKICEAFGANCYPVPEDITKQRQITREVSSRLAELEATLDAGIRHRNKALTSVSIHLAKWTNMVRREKAVYDSLNMLNFDVTKKCLVGEGWCPIFAKTQIQAALQRATIDSSSQVGIIFHLMDAVESPPTYFRTNKLTNAFQEIVDAYGIAGYQETSTIRSSATKRVTMISTSSSLSSSAHFVGPKLVNISGHRSSPNSIKFRAPPISAACTSTAERTGSHSTSTASLYGVLGIQMGATCQEIKTAYRRLARVVHPDVVANGQRGQTSGCEFMKVHEAYTTLSDPDRRADYDRVLYSRRRTGSYPMSMSTSKATMGSGFAGHTPTRRKWETDQCW